MKTRFIVPTLVATLVIAVGAATAAPPATSQPAKTMAAGLLDGKSFTGQLVEKGKSGGKPDTLAFSRGMLHSSACDDYGFQSAAYNAGEMSDHIQFEAHRRDPHQAAQPIDQRPIQPTLRHRDHHRLHHPCRAHRRPPATLSADPLPPRRSHPRRTTC